MPPGDTGSAADGGPPGAETARRLAPMTTTLAVLLLVNAAWNAIVWPQFYKRVSRDDRARDAAGKPTRFLIVHAVLIAISLVIAVVSLIAGIIALVGG